MEMTEFWTICSANGIVLEKSQLDQLKRYEKELKYWNSQVNMISRKDDENIMERHILHSLSILKYVEIPQKSRCLDVGTGGGLPGIPLSIARDDLYMLMVDSIAKKIKMTSMFASHTGIRHLQAICTRAEDLAGDKKNINTYDFVFSRAVSKIERVYSWIKPLLKKSGKMVLLKGGDLTEEISEAQIAFPELRIEQIDIKMFGVDWFEKDEKKIIIGTHF